MRIFTKCLIKRTVACFSAAALLVSAACTITAGAASTADVPAIAGNWNSSATNDNHVADVTVTYPDNAAYQGNESLIALYKGDTLTSVVHRPLTQGADGKYLATHTLDISADADRAKCFVFNNLDELTPTAPVCEKDYSAFCRAAANVPEFNATSGIGVRNSFESGVFTAMFQSNGYNAEIVDDISANTGTKYAKVSGRTAENKTLRVKLTGYAKYSTKTLKVSAFMRKPETVSGAVDFYINIKAPKASSSKTTLDCRSEMVTANDNEWHKVTYDLDLTSLPNAVGGDCVVEIGARQGTDSYTYSDYEVDDITILCPEATATVLIDDIKAGGFKWDFEEGATADWVTETRKMNTLADTNKWTRVLAKHKLEVISTADAEFYNHTTEKEAPKADPNGNGVVKIPPKGSNQMLAVNTDIDSADYTYNHITARVKLSNLDLKPGKTYKISFYAFGNTKDRALYIGLSKHDDNADNPTAFNGGVTSEAGGIINYDETAAPFTNFATEIQRHWGTGIGDGTQKYEYEITPQAANFNSEGFCDLCFVMTENRPKQTKWYNKAIFKGEKLYLDEIEITEVK